MDGDLSGVKWRKARRSSSNGGNCVEVGVWRKSSYSSSNGGDCIEVAVIDKTDPSFKGRKTCSPRPRTRPSTTAST